MLSVASLGFAQTTSLGTITLPLNTPKKQMESVADWSKNVLQTANNAWVESNTVQREKLLTAWAEATPSQMAYLTRVLQQNQPADTAQTIQTLKELFGIIRRITWQPQDIPAMQRVVAAWVVVVPPLVKRIPSTELSATQRRYLEQVLVDLAYLSRESTLASPVARQIWQAEVKTLASMLQHPKHSVKLVSLSVLESLGSDASAAVDQVSKVLNDSDCFVRWAAVRTMQALGLNETTRQQLAKMENDPDVQVRQAVATALQKSVINSDAAPDTKGVPASTKTDIAQQSVVMPPLPPKALSEKTSKTEEAKSTSANSKNAKLEVPNKDVSPSNVPVIETRSVTKPAKKTEPAKVVTPAPLPTLPVSKPLPARKQPVSKEVQPATTAPLFGPAPSTVSQANAKPAIEQTAAVVPATATASTRPTVTTLWISRLRQGSTEQQVQAVMELGRLGAQAHDAIPVLCEYLLRGEVAVRREIPLALAKMGKPARMATAVLERALQDQDTDVKVNAARALLELSE
jgi:HEAT repeat protein